MVSFTFTGAELRDEVVTGGGVGSFEAADLPQAANSSTITTRSTAQRQRFKEKRLLLFKCAEGACPALRAWGTPPKKAAQSPS